MLIQFSYALSTYVVFHIQDVHLLDIWYVFEHKYIHIYMHICVYLYIILYYTHLVQHITYHSILYNIYGVCECVTGANIWGGMCDRGKRGGLRGHFGFHISQNFEVRTSPDNCVGEGAIQQSGTPISHEAPLKPDGQWHLPAGWNECIGWGFPFRWGGGQVRFAE
jgi:hypothetical protein